MGKGLPGALLVGVLLLTHGCSSPVDPNEAAMEEAIAEAPTNCPAGMARAIKRSTGMTAPAPVRPGRIGLRGLQTLIACVITETGKPKVHGRYAVIFMRADASKGEIRSALYQMGFDERRFGHVRDMVRVGQVGDVSFDTFGSVSGNLIENNARAFFPYSEVFPPTTIVLHASIEAKPIEQDPSPPEPLATPSTVNWRCSWSPTYNDNWHDDALCTNGTESTRPYLRANDSFITPDELMSSARQYAQQLNGR